MSRWPALALGLFLPLWLGGCTTPHDEGRSLELATLKPADTLNARWTPSYLPGTERRLYVTQGSLTLFEARMGHPEPLIGVAWAADRGTVDPAGRYTAPPELGKDRVEATLPNGWQLGIDLLVVAAPEVLVFRAEPAALVLGQAALIQAEIPEGCSATLYERTVSSQGLAFINPPARTLAQSVAPVSTMPYLLKVTNPAGDSRIHTLVVEVH